MSNNAILSFPPHCIDEYLFLRQVEDFKALHTVMNADRDAAYGEMSAAVMLAKRAMSGFATAVKLHVRRKSMYRWVAPECVVFCWRRVMLWCIGMSSQVTT